MLISVSDLFCRKKNKTSFKELKLSDWITYDRKHFFINKNGVKYEITLVNESIDDNDIIYISEKIKTTEKDGYLYLSIFNYEKKSLKNESYQYKKATKRGQYFFLNEKGLPAFISYSENLKVKKVKWFYHGQDVTQRVADIVDISKINHPDNLFNEEIKELVEINFSNWLLIYCFFFKSL